MVSHKISQSVPIDFLPSSFLPDDVRLAPLEISFPPQSELIPLEHLSLVIKM